MVVEKEEVKVVAQAAGFKWADDKEVKEETQEVK